MYLVRINVTLPAPRPQPDADYASNLLAAAVHAAQCKLCLRRAMRSAPRENRRALEKLAELQQIVTLTIQRVGAVSR